MDDAELEIEKNKKESIEMAAKIFKIISHPDIVNETTPKERHDLCVKKSKNFANAYPLVLAKMSRELSYNEKAFSRFLDKMHREPGKGMEGVMFHQSNYAKLLYIEECKRRGVHYNMKKANEIFKMEYEHMNKWVKDIKEKETEVKSEYGEEQKRHLQEKRDELLSWMQQANDEIDIGDANLDEIEQEIQELEDAKLQEELDDQKDIIIEQDETNLDEMPELVDYDKYQSNMETRAQNEEKIIEKMETKAKNDWVNNSSMTNWKRKRGKR